MDPLSNLVLGALVGVLIVMAFWLLASLLDALRQQPAFRRRSDLGGLAGLARRSPRGAAPRGAPGP
jgi:hypothetical protein